MYQPKKIIISSGVQSTSLVKTILHNCPSVPVEYREITKDSPHLQKENNLVVTRNKGNFYKPCPGTLNYLCCLYKILHIGLNCPLSCTYCILQSYLEYPALIIHPNLNEMFEELDRLFTQFPNQIFRIGTGEFTDSLVLDHITELTKILVPYFARQQRSFLELKTKTDTIHNLKNLDHQGKTIIAWSLNSSRIVKQEELRATSIEKRLFAAQQCQDWGYPLAFHFDPLIFYPDWEKEYQETIENLFSTIKASRIAWISLGCFRFMPKLKPIIQEKFPHNRLIYEEFIRGLDGKMRYLEIIRQKMYSKMVSWIRQRAPQCFIYLCMESPIIWRNCLGYAPADNEELKSWLDNCCLEVTGSA